jgi:hypothetical protein
MAKWDAIGPLYNAVSRSWMCPTIWRTGPDGTNVSLFIPKVLDHEIVVEVFAVVGIVVTFRTKTFADKETIPF